MYPQDLALCASPVVKEISKYSIEEFMKKQLLPLLFIAAISPYAVSSNFGLGASIKTGESTVYLPIRVSENFLVEPFLRYSKDNSETYSVGSNVSYDTSNTSLNFGVGLFKTTDVSEDIKFYYGGRIAYSNNETRYNISEDSEVNNFTQELDGYTLSPTIGFEYIITNGFSVAIEAEWSFFNLDGEISNSEEPGNISLVEGSSNDGNRTGTNVIIRYVF